MTSLTVGTRTSRLARWQTAYVIERLRAEARVADVQTRTFVTTGDAVRDIPLSQMQQRGVFTTELEQALRSGEIDMAVHSLKDLPTEDAEGLMVGAVPVRADVRDVLVSRKGETLVTLPAGARVGTSSLRRTAQLRARRSDLEVRSIRGNVDTRISKVMDGAYDAAVLAAAGLMRIGLDTAISEWFAHDVMLPAPGQAALAVQCRADDAETRALLAAINDAEAEAATLAERAFLHALGGGCSIPVAAYATVLPDRRTLHLAGAVLSVDGRQRVDVAGKGTDASELGRTLAQQALDRGAGDILRQHG